MHGLPLGLPLSIPNKKTVSSFEAACADAVVLDRLPLIDVSPEVDVVDARRGRAGGAVVHFMRACRWHRRWSTPLPSRTTGLPQSVRAPSAVTALREGAESPQDAAKLFRYFETYRAQVRGFERKW